MAARSISLHPPALAAAYVLAVFAASPAPPDILWRPLAVAIVLALAIEALLVLLLRRRHWAAVASTATVFVLAGLWPFALLVAGPAAWRIARRRLRGASAGQGEFLSPQQIDSVLRPVGAAALIIALVVMVASDPDRWTAPSRPDPAAHAPADSPDIYIIWLDAYPSSTTLQTTFEYDNSPFLAALRSREFEIAEDSRSNYSQTWLTMSSMFHARYAHEIPQLADPSPDPVSQFKQLRRAVNDAPVMDQLRGMGYTIVSSQGAFTEAGYRNAEVVLDDGQLNQLEEQMMRLTALAQIVDAVDSDWFGRQARTRVLSSFEHLAAMAGRESPSGPVAMIAQVMAPHAPFVFASDGSARPAPSCHPRSCFLWETEIHDLGLEAAEYRDGLVGQLQFTNARVLDTIDRIVSLRPDAVIVLMSDHGTRYRTDDVDEFFQNFFAARTPGRSIVFPEDVSPVNVYPLLFNAYFDQELDTRDYAAWYATSTSPLNLTRYE